MMGERLLVTVVIPTRNRPKELVRAFESVLAQTYRPLQILLVEDGVSSGTESTLKKLCQGQTEVELKILSNQKSLGAPACRNLGIREARGELCAFLDDDDVWLPRKLEVQVAMLVSNPELALVSCDYVIVKKGQRIGEVHTSANPGGEQARMALKMSNILGSCSFVVARTKQLLEVGGFDPKMPSAQDWDLWLTVAFRFGGVAITPEILVEYSEDSHPRISGSRWRRTKGLLALAFKHRQKFKFPEFIFLLLRSLGTLLLGIPGISFAQSLIGKGSRAYLKRKFGLSYEFDKRALSGDKK